MREAHIAATGKPILMASPQHTRPALESFLNDSVDRCAWHLGWDPLRVKRNVLDDLRSSTFATAGATTGACVSPHGFSCCITQVVGASLWLVCDAEDRADDPSSYYDPMEIESDSKGPGAFNSLLEIRPASWKSAVLQPGMSL